MGMGCGKTSAGVGKGARPGGRPGGEGGVRLHALNILVLGHVLCGCVGG